MDFSFAPHSQTGLIHFVLDIRRLNGGETTSKRSKEAHARSGRISARSRRCSFRSAEAKRPPVQKQTQRMETPPFPGSLISKGCQRIPVATATAGFLLSQTQHKGDSDATETTPVCRQDSREVYQKHVGMPTAALQPWTKHQPTQEANPEHTHDLSAHLAPKPPAASRDILPGLAHPHCRQVLLQT